MPFWAAVAVDEAAKGDLAALRDDVEIFLEYCARNDLITGSAVDDSFYA